jgi:hypothetical protein
MDVATQIVTGGRLFCGSKSLRFRHRSHGLRRGRERSTDEMRHDFFGFSRFKPIPHTESARPDGLLTGILVKNALRQQAFRVENGTAGESALLQ